MRNLILKTNCIIISIAVLFLTIGNPKTARASDPENANKTSMILLGAAVVLAITVIVVVIVKSSKKKKQQALLQQQLNYSDPYNSILVDYRLIAPKQNQVKHNNFAAEYFKSNLKSLSASNSILQTNWHNYSYDNWKPIIFRPQSKSMVINTPLDVKRNDPSLCLHQIQLIN